MASKTPGVKSPDEGSICALSNQLKKININSVDKEQVLKDIIPSWLKNCESAFIWHSQMQRALSTEHIIERCLEKLEELSSDNNELSLRRYTILLKLVVEYFISENQNQVEECLKLIKSCIKRDAALKTPQYEKLELLLDHVVFATEAHLLALTGQEEQSKEIVKKITPISQMPNYTQAGLYAMKSNFFLYSGYENAEDIAVKMARKALELEPEYHEWLYLLAKVLRQQRKDIPFNVEVPREELVLLEKAVNLCSSSKYLQYLAQVYRECATQSHRKYRNDPAYFSSKLYQLAHGMNEKALSYYKKALEIDPDHTGNLRRIGYGIMNLPRNLADYELALNCLLKSLKLCETTDTLHILGTFYHRYGNDNKKALEYYEMTAKRGSHAGLSDMIRVKFIENPGYDPCEDIEEGLKWEIKKKNKMFLLTQQGGYFLFIKRDFLKSVQYFNQVILDDKDTTNITVYKCIFLRMYETINLYHYLANEALLYLKDNTENEDDNVYEVMALLDTITNIHPDLADIDPDPLLIQKLLDSSKQIVEKERGSNRPPRQREPRYQQLLRGRGDGRISQARGHSYREKPFNNDDIRGSSFSGSRRNTDHARNNYERNRSGDSYSGRGRNHNNENKTGQNKCKADEDSNWRRKD